MAIKNKIIVSLSDYTSDARYKAEIRVVSPESARSTLAKQKNCFVGISLDSPNFLGSKLQSIVDYVSRRHESCVFLLGDHVHRLTLQIRKDLSPEQCFYHALGLGDYFMRTQGHMLRNSETGKPFTVIRGSEIFHDPRVKACLSHLKQQFSDNADFKQAVEGFASQFIARSDENKQETDKSSEVIDLSCKYVLEELAETCFMISQGHNVLAYPGSLAIFQQISDGVFTGLPAELSKLVNVSLRLKRRGKKPAALSQPMSSSQ